MNVLPLRARHPLTTLAAVLALGVPLTACQPVDDLDDVSGPSSDLEGVEEADRRGAPAGQPSTLSEAIDLSETEAAQWQDGARLAEVFVQLDEGEVTAADLTYLAPDADRLLSVQVDPEGIQREQPTLATLGLAPVTGQGLDELPDLPEDTQDPADLIEVSAEVFADCEAEEPATQLLYATGAPHAWDPEAQAWATPLTWTVTVTDAHGAGVVIDPVTAERAECLPPVG